MIEEQVQVVAIENGQLLLEAQSQSACGACAAKKGCGTAVLSSVVGKKFSRFRVANSIDANVGDTVVIGIKEQALLNGSLVIYLLPIACMIIMALLADTVLPELVLDGQDGLLFGRDLDIALSSITGFAAGAALARRYFLSSRRQTYYQPVVLRKVKVIV